MAYRMHELTNDVRAGITSAGALNIEVRGRHPNGQPNDEDFQEILLPREAVEELFQFLRSAA